MSFPSTTLNIRTAYFVMSETLNTAPVQDLWGRRIAILNWRDKDHPKVGGAEKYALNVCEQLAARGASVTYVTSRHKGASKTDSRDGYQIVRGGNVITVYLHTLWWLLKNRTKVDGVLDASNGVGFFSPLVLRRKTPVVYLVHHVHTDQWGQHMPAPVAAFGRFLEGPVTKFIYRNARWAGVSQSTRDALKNRIGVKSPIVVAANGLDQSQHDRIAANVEYPTKANHIVFLGRVVPHKRVDMIIDAVKVLVERGVDVTLDMIAAGDMVAGLEEQAKGLPVVFHGRVDEQTRDRILGEAAVIAVPSSHEGWGLVVIEAAAAGTPAIGFNVDGIRDSIRDGETGWIIPNTATGTDEEVRAQRVNALADAFEVAMKVAADADARKSMRTACQTWAASFTWAATGQVITDAMGLGNVSQKESE
jgi:glycosyltransferase involved in cell wall biosynthesis